MGSQVTIDTTFRHEDLDWNKAPPALARYRDARDVPEFLVRVEASYIPAKPGDYNPGTGEGTRSQGEAVEDVAITLTLPSGEVVELGPRNLSALALEQLTVDLLQAGHEQSREEPPEPDYDDTGCEPWG